MSLDQNLFTLVFAQNKDHRDVIDLVDPSGTVHYHKRKLPGPEYKIEVYDPFSQAHLLTATAPSAASKTKTLELHNPTILVELRYTGTLSFKWHFKWEQHEFEWKRSECYLIRKPDPPVLVAITKETTGRLKTIQVQIMDYNLNRFDIEDRKGLEIVILTALMTFNDSNEASHEPPATLTAEAPSQLKNRKSTAKFSLAAASTTTEAPPPPPPKPAPKTGVDRIAEKQAQEGDYNEVIVDEEGSFEDYAIYCNNLLSDDAMLFVSVKSSGAETVPKVLQVVEEAKRIRYKAGLDEDDELHQYVLYDTEEKKKGPRRINLDDSATKKAAKYTPPSSLTVHLSKIDMPELQPKGNVDKGKRKATSSGGSKVPLAAPKPRHATPPLPTPVTPPQAHRPSSSPPGKNNTKPHKGKLTRPPRESERGHRHTPESKPTTPTAPTPTTRSPPPHAHHPQHAAASTGLFNAAPSPSQTRKPSPPSKPGLGLHNTFVPHITPGGPNSTVYPVYQSYSQQQQQQHHPPPPPPPAPTGIPGNAQHGGGGGSSLAALQAQLAARPLSTMGNVATSVVSGLFDKLNHHRR